MHHCHYLMLILNHIHALWTWWWYRLNAVIRQFYDQAYHQSSDYFWCHDSHSSHWWWWQQRQQKRQRQQHWLGLWLLLLSTTRRTSWMLMKTVRFVYLYKMCMDHDIRTVHQSPAQLKFAIRHTDRHTDENEKEREREKNQLQLIGYIGVYLFIQMYFFFFFFFSILITKTFKIHWKRQKIKQ